MKIQTEHGEINYTPVHERIKLLKEGRVDYATETSYTYIREERRFIVLAILKVFKPSGERHYTGHASEVIGEGGEANEFSALENAETSAVGRALAFAGYGIDAGIASAEEVRRVIEHTATPEQIVEKLSAHLKSLTTKESVDKTATEFRSKYPKIYAQTQTQKMFKKRIGELAMGTTLVTKEEPK